jgi:peptidyl-prolyl cis-trans isomerase B (cyclophilin B)
MRTIIASTFLLLAFTMIATAQIDPKPQYVITVTRGGVPLGTITLEMYPDVAPKHVHNFDSLVRAGFYDGTAFHRVIPGFMIQGGGFYSKEEGAPKEEWGYSDDSQTRVPAEFSNLKHVRGIVSMARLGNDVNSGTSQFFICVATASHLDGQYSIFGHVIDGMKVVDTIVKSPRDANDSPNEKVEMTIVPKVIASAVPAAVPLAEGCSIAAEPSVSSGDLRLRYAMAEPGPVSLVLFDATGRAVRTLVDDVETAGERTIRCESDGLPSGIYIARLRAGAAVATSRFVIAR